MRTPTLVKTLYSQFSVVSGTAMLRSRVVGSLELAEPNDHHAKGNGFLPQTLHHGPSFSRITLQHQVKSQVIVDDMHNMLKGFVRYASASVCFIAAFRSECAL